MNAVVFPKARELTVETVADPELERATDALIRLTSSGSAGPTCTSTRAGWVSHRMVIEHEPLGVVEEVGSAVVSVKPGDQREDDFVLLADAFPTAYHAAVLAAVAAGDSVAVPACSRRV